MELSAVLTPAIERGYVALNPETGTTTQGESIAEAIENLKPGRVGTAHFLSHPHLGVVGRASHTLVRCTPSISPPQKQNTRADRAKQNPLGWTQPPENVPSMVGAVPSESTAI